MQAYKTGNEIFIKQSILKLSMIILNLVYVFLNKDFKPIESIFVISFYFLMRIINNKKVINIKMLIFLIMGYFFNNLWLFIPTMLLSNISHIFVFSIFILFFVEEYLLIVMGTVYFLFSVFLEEVFVVNTKSKIIRDKAAEEYLKEKREFQKFLAEKRLKEEMLILNERTRILRQVHNSVGHTISSSIMQLKALSMIENDEYIKDNLKKLKDFLTDGMNEIRISIRNDYKESFNLELKVDNLLKILGKKSDFNYNITNEIDYNLKCDLFNIIKEAVTNFIKYSNGDEIKINLLENPKCYILKISDNGIVKDEIRKGMGILNMEETVKKYNGVMNISIEKGFNIYFIFNKEKI